MKYKSLNYEDFMYSLRIPINNRNLQNGWFFLKNCCITTIQRCN